MLERGELDGEWRNAAGTSMGIISKDTLLWDGQLAAHLLCTADGHLKALQLDGGDSEDFTAVRDGSDILRWSDGDVWMRHKVDHKEKAMDISSERPDVLASTSRIMRAKTWHDILGVKAAASADEIRHAFHELALLHHPDKCAAEESVGTFQRIQGAYEEGLKKQQQDTCSAMTKSQNKGNFPPATTAANPPTAASMRATVSASRKQLRAALVAWEEAIDLGKTSRPVDQVPKVNCDELAEWLQAGTVIVVDVREGSEKMGWQVRKAVPEAVVLPYLALLKAPESLTKEVSNLLDDFDKNSALRVVCYSSLGGSSGTCAAVCSILTDVFGLDDSRLFSLEDGYIAWKQWAQSHPDQAKELNALTLPT